MTKFSLNRLKKMYYIRTLTIKNYQNSIQLPMKKQFLIILTFIFSIVLTLSNSFAQSLEGVEINCKGGYFESYSPWGNGTIGVIATQYYAVTPKNRSFQYFNEKGELAWDVKVKPFNFNNTTIVNSDSKYCYYINMPFGSTAMLEQKSKDVFLNIHQIDLKGNLKEKALSYSNSELSGIKDYIKNMNKCFVGAYNDGLIFVSTNNHKNYHVIKVGADFSVSYKMITLEWDETAYRAFKLSKPIYVLDDNTFYIIQTKLEENAINATAKMINLLDFSVTENQHSLDMNGYNLYATPNVDDYHIVSSLKTQLFMKHEIRTNRGNTTYINPSLGAFTHYEVANGLLKCYAYYRNTDEDRKSTGGEGFVVYNITNEEDDLIEPQSVFEFSANKDAAKSYALEMLPSGEFVFFTKESNKKLTLKTSEGYEKNFAENLTIAQAFASYILAGDEVSTELDEAFLQNGKYVFTKDHGRGILFNFKKVTIYREKE